MISINNKRYKLIIKLSLLILLVYVIGFFFFQLTNFFKISFEKDKLTKDLQMKKQETISIKRKIARKQNKTKEIETSFIKKDDIDKKVKKIFKRMSVLNYNLKYLDSKKMCIDNYIFVTQLTARSEEGLKAGEGILSYLGEVKKSEKNNTIYFVNYILKPKDIKK